MNGFGGGNLGGSGCIYPPFHIEQCKKLDDFTQALLNGIDAGGRYIEVQPSDVAVQYAPAFEKALQAIQVPSRVK